MCVCVCQLYMRGFCSTVEVLSDVSASRGGMLSVSMFGTWADVLFCCVWLSPFAKQGCRLTETRQMVRRTLSRQGMEP